MYVILVYDVDAGRVAKVCNYLRQHLHWVQESVFEGEISQGKLEKVKAGLARILDVKVDSVYIYKFRDRRWVEKEVVGVEKGRVERFL